MYATLSCRIYYERDLDFFDAVLVTKATEDCSPVDYMARTSQQFIDVIVSYIGWSKKSGTTFGGHNFEIACKISPKRHTTFPRHVFNHFVNFQRKWTTNVKMTVALKLGVEKSNIVNTSNWMCMTCTLYGVLLK